MRAYMPCPSHLPWIGHCNYTWWNFWLCSFPQSPIISSHFGPNILLSTLFSNTLSLCSSLNVKDQASHPCKTTGKIIILCILIFTFLDNRREDSER
jgi:hypothetical protein